ncbi:hypothetical protein DNTS_024841 [Danionella cerebrum]|uniref:XPG N-terminal domain-containing protein n=1 Tax=Danionella cerebrum TaxID=2873325 RepID=A0A553QS37_9TELE|nr:hypothetical protein DNTS_024841 [Danionella translucida]
MGVHGLWKLLESTGRPINPETLEGKILAVASIRVAVAKFSTFLWKFFSLMEHMSDISIWLNQAVKGVRDGEGNTVRNAHLLTLFHRLCKLLFFRIKPVFVFDGDAPLLKKQTLAIRRQRREELSRESKQTTEKLLQTFLKRQAIKAALGNPSQESFSSLSSVRRDEQDDMYVLPALPPVEERDHSSSGEENEADNGLQSSSILQEELYNDPNSVDINSEEFSLMPPEIQHEILKEMKEFSKRRRTLFHKPPERSGDFSQYQLSGLLQRNQLNQRLERVEQELNQRNSGGAQHAEHQSGTDQSVEVRRLVSEDTSHYILIKGSEKKPSTEVSHSVPLWSGCSWESRKTSKGRPEPLWRPVMQEEDEKPSSSSSFSQNQVLQSKSEDEEGNVSPGTLQAIHTAMLELKSEYNNEHTSLTSNSSKLKEGRVSPKTLRAIQRALLDSGSEGEDGSMSPQTQEAIKASMMDFKDANLSSSKTSVMESKSEDEDKNSANGSRCSVTDPKAKDGRVSPKTQRALLDSGSEGEDGSMSGFRSEDANLSSSKTPVMKSKSEDGSVSPKTQRALLDSGSEDEIVSRTLEAFQSSKTDSRASNWYRPKPVVITSSSEEDEQSEDQSPDASMNKEDSQTTFFFTSGASQSREETNQTLNTPGSPPQKRSHVNTYSEGPKNERIADQIDKMEDDESTSSSEENFIEVSDVEEPPTKEEHHEKSHEPEERDQEESSTRIEDSDDVKETANEALAASDWDHIDLDDLLRVEQELQDKQRSLTEEQQQKERSSNTVTSQMSLESQELLRLFGVPFVLAPSEAEAQCAALERLDQTNGTITDDSDIWLFGARCVYRNFFSHGKHTLQYHADDMTTQLGLDRSRLINLAYLLGSDYTEGLAGVGHVSGMEILNEFPGTGLEPLRQLSEWWSEAQESRKISVNHKESKVKRKLRNLTLPNGFPNPAVAQAYLEPSVDQAEAGFSWARPQLTLLKEYPDT